MLFWVTMQPRGREATQVSQSLTHTSPPAEVPLLERAVGLNNTDTWARMFPGAREVQHPS